MMVLRKFLLPALFFLAAALFAQEAGVAGSPGSEAVAAEAADGSNAAVDNTVGEVEETAKPFPAVLLLEAAELSAAELWQPDWPPAFPPDAFTQAVGDWVSITVSGVSDSGGDFTVRRGNGLVTEFPCIVEGVLTQAVLAYAPAGDGKPLLKKIDLRGAAVLEVLEYKEDLPYLLRVYRAGLYSFVYIERTAGAIYESWYDTDGKFLEQYTFIVFQDYAPNWPRSGPARDSFGRIIGYRSTAGRGEVFRSFDSRFLVTGITGGGHDCSVFYVRDFLPRYTRQKIISAETSFDLHCTYQWDANDFLVRLIAEPVNGGAAGSRYTDSRYEYTLDEKGNWIERREMRMVKNFDLLVPEQGAVITRVLEYAVPE